MAQIRHAIRMETEINESTVSHPFSRSKKILNLISQSWLSLFSTPGNRKRMLLIIAISVFSQWSGNGLVSYYINLVLDGIGMTSTKQKTSINGALQVCAIYCDVRTSTEPSSLGV